MCSIFSANYMKHYPHLGSEQKIPPKMGQNYMRLKIHEMFKENLFDICVNCCVIIMCVCICVCQKEREILTIL